MRFSFDKDIDERSQSYLATVETRLQNLENSNKLVLDKVKNSISITAFNDFAEKNNTRLDAFEEELYGIKDNLESLHEKCKSMNNTILTNPTPIQTNGTAPYAHTDNLKRLLLRHRYHDQLMSASKEQTTLCCSTFRSKVMNQIRTL